MRRNILCFSLLAAACGDNIGSAPPDARTSGAADALPPGATITRLHQGARLHGTNGIHFGPDGQLYVASLLEQAIVVMDPETGEITQRLGPESNVRGPDDLAFAPDGSLYWTDMMFGDIGRRGPDGQSSIIASPGVGVNPITVSDDGRVFTSQCFLGASLYEIDPGGQAPRLITDELGPGCGLNGMDWGPDGMLYGPRWFLGTVARVNVDTGAVATVASGFAIPAAVKFDSQGRLHVLDTQSAEVVRVDLDTGDREVVARLATPRLDNLAFDAGDRLFVSSYADGFIHEVTGLESIRVVSPGGMVAPGGAALLATSAGPRLYIADFFALRELDPASGEELSVVRDVVGVSPLGSVMSMHTYGEYLLASSWFDNKVKVWDPDTATLIAEYADFQLPVDALPFAGGIMVVNHSAGTVVRIDPMAPKNPGTPIIVAADLQEPAGLAAHGDTLYLAERGTGRILELIADGMPIMPPRIVASDLAQPEGLAVADDGALFAVEVGAGRVIRVDPETAAITEVAGGLELGLGTQAFFPSTMLLSSIATDGTSLYVTVDGEKAVYRIDLP